jgi:hypothetical protein
LHKLELLQLEVCGLVFREQCETEHVLPAQQLLAEIVDTIEAWIESAPTGEPAEAR